MRLVPAYITDYEFDRYLAVLWVAAPAQMSYHDRIGETDDGGRVRFGQPFDKVVGLVRRGRVDPVEYGLIHDRAELRNLIDSESRRLLGIPGDEFLSLKASGTLPEKRGARTLSMLADLETIS